MENNLINQYIATVIVDTGTLEDLLSEYFDLVLRLKDKNLQPEEKQLLSNFTKEIRKYLIQLEVKLNALVNNKKIKNQAVQDVLQEIKEQEEKLVLDPVAIKEILIKVWTVLLQHFATTPIETFVQTDSFNNLIMPTFNESSQEEQ